MTKRKKFQIADDINRGITEVINAVHDNIGAFRYEVIPLTRIEIDPDNPRELVLTDQNIVSEIDENDPLSSRKKRERNDLESLSHTIRQNGIINPIVVYKHGDKYRVIAGERRFLASLLAEKNDIHAKIVNQRPDEIDLKLLQWIENNERKDLSLNERLKNLEAIIEAYSKNHVQEPITGEILGKLTGLSRAQAHYYLAILRGPSDLRKKIEENLIDNIHKANLIAGITDDSLREKVLLACVNGSSMDALKNIIVKSKQQAKSDLRRALAGKKRGPAAKCVHLGRTDNTRVIKKIIEVVIAHPNYNKHANEFNNVMWDEYEEVTSAFQKLLNFLTEECE